MLIRIVCWFHDTGPGGKNSVLYSIGIRRLKPAFASSLVELKLGLPTGWTFQDLQF